MMKILTFKDFYEIIEYSETLRKKGFSVKETIVFEHPKTYEMKVELIKDGKIEMTFFYAKFKEKDKKQTVDNVLLNSKSNVIFKDTEDFVFYEKPFEELSRKEQIDIIYDKNKNSLSKTLRGVNFSLEDHELMLLNKDKTKISLNMSNLKEIALNKKVDVNVLFEYSKKTFISLNEFVKARYKNQKIGKEVIVRFLIQLKFKESKIKTVIFNGQEIIFTKHNEIFALEKKCNNVGEAIKLIKKAESQKGFDEISNQIISEGL